MDPVDRPAFATAMTRLFAIYGDELTESLLDAWWGVLAPYELRDVRQAMNAHATDPDKGRFRPTPADMIRHITETLPAKRRQLYVQRIRDARDRCAPLEEKLYRLKADIRNGIETDHRAVMAQINGLAMQIAAIQREAEINDSPRIEHATGGMRLLAEELPDETA